MVPGKKILETFVSDALRLSTKASICINELAEQAGRGQVSPAQVMALYRVVHTLKGTATMVAGAERVVQALHRLEARLATQPVAEVARSHDWIELAKVSVRQAHVALIELERQHRLGMAAPAPKPAAGSSTVPTVSSPPVTKGLVARARLKGKDALLWYPLGCLTRIFAPKEIAGKEAMSIQGKWVPVMGRKSSPADQSFFGLAIRTESGHAVIAVLEIVGVFSWDEASEQGASEGLAILSAPDSEHSSDAPKAA